MNNLVIALFGGLAGMVGYGVADFLAKKTIDKLGSRKTLFYSQLVGFLFIALYLFKDSSLPIISFKNVIYISLFGIFFALGYLSLYKAFEIGKISIVSPISSSFILLTAGVSFLFFGEPFSNLKIISVALVGLGIILIAINLKEFQKGFSWSSVSKGLPQALLAFLIFGLYFPFWDKFIEGPGWAVWTILARVPLIFFLFFSMGLSKKESLKLDIKQKSLIYLLVFIAFFEALAGLSNSWAFNASAGTTSVVVAATATYPLVTILLAHLFLQERLAKNQYVGIGLIMGGLILMPFV